MAPKAKNQEDNQQSIVPLPFHQRFNIEIDLEEAQRRFMNRVNNVIPDCFNRAKSSDPTLPWSLATFLGMAYMGQDRLEAFLGDDFYSCLRTLEEAYRILPPRYQKEFTVGIETILSLSEVDLGIQWRDGAFYPSGAKLLDEALVNENLKWLSDSKYSTVLAPFEKGLGHYLEAQRQPEKLADVITDMYEALEKMARITNGNNKTLGQNAEQFIGNLNLSEYYKTMLREYTKYAHEFRHAVEQGKERVPPLPNEVEAFVYTTGLFIRLAIQQANQ